MAICFRVSDSLHATMYKLRNAFRYISMQNLCYQFQNSDPQMEVPGGLTRIWSSHEMSLKLKMKNALNINLSNFTNYCIDQ